MIFLKYIWLLKHAVCVCLFGRMPPVFSVLIYFTELFNVPIIQTWVVCVEKA